ncbi:hypothetical protein ACUH92_02640 [Dermabacteraceae bacterium CCM 9520]
MTAVMHPSAAHHYLLAFDHAKKQLVASLDFGTNNEEALVAYEKLEQEHKDNPAMDVVLVGSDSLESVKITHSTYFGEKSVLDRVKELIDKY